MIHFWFLRVKFLIILRIKKGDLWTFLKFFGYVWELSRHYFWLLKGLFLTFFQYKGMINDHDNKIDCQISVLSNTVAKGAHPRYDHRWAWKMSTFYQMSKITEHLFSDEHFLKKWATKMGTFFSDEQSRWALFSRWVTNMRTFSSGEQPRWALYTRWAS